MQILLESQAYQDVFKAHEREHGLGSSTTKCSPGKFRRVIEQMLGRFEEELEIWTPAGSVSGTSNQQFWMTKSSWERVEHLLVPVSDDRHLEHFCDFLQSGCKRVCRRHFVVRKERRSGKQRRASIAQRFMTELQFQLSETNGFLASGIRIVKPNVFARFFCLSPSGESDIPWVYRKAIWKSFSRFQILDSSGGLVPTRALVNSCNEAIGRAIGQAKKHYVDLPIVYLQEELCTLFLKKYHVVLA